MPNVEYVNVWKYYGGKPVVKGVNLRVKEGEVRVLLGPNGSGKSTLFKMSVGVVKPDQGEVRVNGVNAAEDPITARKVVGYMPEDPFLYESLEVTEYLEFNLSVYGVRPSREKFAAVIKALGLEEHVGKLIGELSHGNRRKVMLATIMLRDPQILVLDEAFSGLDVGSVRAIKTWLRNKAESGAAVLVSTHILPIAEAIADNVTIIYEGRVVAEGTPKELRSLEAGKELEDIYLKLTGYSSEVEELVKALTT